MSAKKLYARLVDRIMTRWLALYPMYEWRDVETSIDRIIDELLALRAERISPRDALLLIFALDAIDWTPAGEDGRAMRLRADLLRTAETAPRVETNEIRSLTNER